MSLPHDAIQDAARRLFAAEKNRKQIRQLSIEFPGMTIDDAYAVQKALVDLKVTAGAVVRGHKIGLTSKAMQSALNIDEPDSGVLLDDMFFNDGGIVPADRFIATRVEAFFSIARHGMGGQGDDRNITGRLIGFQSARGFPAINHGQAHIHEDEGRRFVGHHFQRFAAIHGDDHFKTLSGQTPGQHVSIHLIVFDEQDFRHGFLGAGGMEGLLQR